MTADGLRTSDKLTPELTDTARNRWSSFLEAAGKHGLQVPDAADACEAFKTAMTLSPFVARSAVRRPWIAVELLACGDITRDYGAGSTGWYQRFQRQFRAPDITARLEQWDSIRQTLTDAEFEKQLRLFRNREMVRIAVRDLSGLADLDGTLADLSSLADACIQQALEFHHDRLRRTWGTPTDADGRPQQLVVLGMGKLGAGELNFSSDVDLIFAYPREGRTCEGSKATTNEDFFIRLSRKLIHMIGATTEDGFVFRVDARLRPFGEAGPLALSFSRMEDYYQVHGREWERYALIKARVVAGDFSAGKQLLKDLRPFVYRRYLDYNAIDALRDMKQRIATEVRSKGLQDNIKLGPGGIREVEFFGQMFQLLRGGVQPDLQTRDIQSVLKHLVAYSYIPPQTGADLTEAYVFLRRTENRIQAYADEQQHNLPSDPAHRSSLAAAMGFEDWAQFEQALSSHRRKVHEHFNALLATSENGLPDSEQDKDLLEELSAVWQNVLGDHRTGIVLEKTGFSDSSDALRLIAELREDGALRPMSAMGKQRLAKIMPLLLRAAGSADHPRQVLLRLITLIKSICRRTAYLSLLCEYPAILARLVHLFEASPWIAELLSRYPVLLDELLDPRTLYRPIRQNELTAELRARLSGVAEDDLEHQLEVLRIFKQTNMLRVAASDITNVLPLMKISDHLSDIAEVVVNEVVALSWRHLAAKHGLPTCSLADKPCRQGFAVIAYGKLGGLELGYRSDLDLVFLHAAAPGQTRGGRLPIDNAQFFARLGQRVLHILTAHTDTGRLYETDMRLRPSGSSGLLVSHIEGFADYQRTDAWTWEHQALIRARAIAGEPNLQRRFEQIREEILTRRREPDVLRKEVAGMRRQLFQARAPGAEGTFNIKDDRGGIMDIEFMVQYLLLGHAHRYPEIIRWTDNVRQLQALSHFGIIDQQTAYALRRAYLVLRAAGHRLNLKGIPAHIEKDRFRNITDFVLRCWHRYLS